jgi:molecular chaperone HscB
MDHFERLGLPRRFSLDAAEIERQYLARSRAAHPDFFQAGGTSEQRASLELSAALNEAYATLRDPFRRAEHLLQIEGGPTAAEMKEMPAAFLEEMLELRMEIEEIKQEPESPAFAAMEKQLAQRRDGLLGDAESRFAKLADGSVRQPLLREIRQLLNATKYVQGLIRDLHAD